MGLCLDLPETRNFIHGSGQVIWSDQSVLAGSSFPRFPSLREKSSKSGLFANLLIACANHAARHGTTRASRCARPGTRKSSTQLWTTRLETAAASLASVTVPQRTSALSSLDEVPCRSVNSAITPSNFPVHYRGRLGTHGREWRCAGPPSARTTTRARGRPDDVARRNRCSSSAARCRGRH